MRSRLFSLLFAFLLISLLTGFSGVSIKAYAVDLPQNGHFMTVAETRQFIGDSFPVEYYTSNGVVETVAHYNFSQTGYVSEFSEAPLGFPANLNASWLFYTITVSGVSTIPTEITCRLQPTYSIFDTNFVYTCFALSSGNNFSSIPSSATYYSPTSNWYVGGSVNNFSNSSESAADSGKHAYLSMGYSMGFTYIPIAFSSATSFSAYCIDCNFYGNTPQSNTTYYFAVMCPFVSGSATGGSGAFTTAEGSSGSDINVNVDVDMSETNGILGRIETIMGGLVDGIKGLFIPSEDDITDFKTDISDLLTDTFSGYSEASDYMDQVSDVLISSDPSAVLEFPALSVPGTSFVTPAKSIDLNFDSGIIETVKYIIDIIATICVLNLIMDKVKAVLVGEKVVEVEGFEDDY